MNFLDTALGSGVALESGMRRGTVQPPRRGPEDLINHHYDADNA
jgi:hypothetical protein